MNEKVKKFVETMSGKVASSNGALATAKFSTETDAIIFCEELESKRVCCGFDGSDFTSVRFQENHLGEVLV